MALNISVSSILYQFRSPRALRSDYFRAIPDTIRHKQQAQAARRGSDTPSGLRFPHFGAGKGAATTNDDMRSPRLVIPRVPSLPTTLVRPLLDSLRWLRAVLFARRVGTVT